MLNRRFHETVVLEYPDGTTVDVPRALCREADISDQSVMDVQTRFINQARYKGDSRTLMVVWPKDAPHDVMDCHVWVRGERYRVYGQPFPVRNSPTAHDMRVTVSRSLFLYDAELLVPDEVQDEWGGWKVTYQPRPVKANLLRLSEDVGNVGMQTAMGGIVLLELEPDSWDAACTAFRFQGNDYHIASTDYAGEVVVISGTRESVDGELDVIRDEDDSEVGGDG